MEINSVLQLVWKINQGSEIPLTSSSFKSVHIMKPLLDVKLI